MVPSLANPCQFVTCVLITAAMDSCLSPTGDPYSTRHLALRTILIPSSPANGIVQRIFESGLPRKVSYIQRVARLT